MTTMWMTAKPMTLCDDHFVDDAPRSGHRLKIVITKCHPSQKVIA
jgi:hypothetical protein